MLKEIDIDLDYDQIVKEYFDLDIDQMLDNRLKQVAIQRRKQTPEDEQYTESCGSLYFDWLAYEKNPVGPIPIRKTDKDGYPALKEKDFNVTCDMFKDTIFDKIIQKLKGKNINVTRGRFMYMLHKTCLTMHKDPSPRVHIPIYTNENCMMLFNDKVVRLPFGGTYYVDTTIPHTALNASKDPRVHLIFSVEEINI
jgi:hypothetical protein